MIPKRVYLRSEELEEHFTCKRMVSCEDPIGRCNVEYTALSQLWHDATEEPENDGWIISECDSEYRSIDWGNVTSGLWYGWDDYVSYYGVRRWAYINDILPKD